ADKPQDEAAPDAPTGTDTPPEEKAPPGGGDEVDAAPDGEQADEVPDGEQPPDGEPTDEEDVPGNVELPAERGGSSFGSSVSGGVSAEQSGSAYGAFPNPAEDQRALAKQGQERPKEIDPGRIFAEDWWSHTRPTLELHGNFRVR